MGFTRIFCADEFVKHGISFNTFRRIAHLLKKAFADCILASARQRWFNASVGLFQVVVDLHKSSTRGKWVSVSFR